MTRARLTSRSLRPAPIDPERLLTAAAAAGCREAEVFVDRHTQTPVTFENGELAMLEATDGFLLSLRLVSGGRVGFATTSRPDDYAVVERAVRAAAYGPPGDFSFASPDLAAGARDVPLNDSTLEELPTARLVDLGQELVDASLARDADANVSVRLQRWMGEMRLANSNGVDVSFRRTFLAVQMSGEIVEPDGIVRVFRGEAANRLRDLDFARLKDDYLADLGLARTRAPATSGPCRVLFDPSAVPDLLLPVSAAVSGQAFARGVSPWLGSTGRQVADPQLTLVDDATLPYGPASAPCDDEGVATRPTAILEEGVFRGPLTDLRAAAKLGRPPSGHGYRRGGNPPGPGRSNWILAPGTIAPDRLLAELGDGVLVRLLMGSGSGNILAGEVSGAVLIGYLARGGELVGRLRDCLLRVNAFEVLRGHLLGLGTERRWNLSNCLAPPILVDGADLTAR